jgi:PAS domain S-box-containing protein/putative nucleotidyltransferase with HDIG domain
MKHYDDKAKRELLVYIVTFLFLAIGIAASGQISYGNFKRDFRQQVENQISAIAELKVNGLVNWRGERMGDAQFFYHNSAFSELVKRYFENPQDIEAQNQILSRLGHHQSYTQYERVYLLDVDGIQRLTVPAAPGEVDAHLAAEAAACLDSGEIIFWDFQRDAGAGNEIHISILVPVFSGKNFDHPLGVLVLRIDPETYLYPYASQWPIPSDTAETLLVRRDGQDVLFLNRLRFGENAALALRFPLTDTSIPAVKAVLGQTGIVEGLDYRGEPVLADVRAVPDSPWYLVSKMDTAEVYAPLRTRGWQTLTIIGMAILVAGAGLVASWRQQRLIFYRAQARAAEALRESEEKFRKAFMLSPDAVNINRVQDGMYISINHGFTKIMGYTAKDVSGKTSLDLNVWADPQDRQKLVDGLSKNSEMISLEARFRAKNGDIKYGLMSASMLELNGIPHIISITHDITRRKQAEEALRESEDRYRTLVEFSPDGIGIHCEGKFVYVNTAAVNLLHANSPQDLIGISNIQFVHPDHQAAVMERIRRSYENREVAPMLVEKFITMDGQLIDVEVSTTPIIYNGKAAAQIIMRDVTRRVQTEEALANSEAELRALVEQVPAIVYTESAETRETLYISPQLEKLTGYTSAEWIADPGLWKEMIHPEDQAAVVEADQYTSASREPFQIEYRILTRDKRTLWIHDEAVIIESQGKTPLFWQGVMYDITGRKQAEKAIQESERFARATVDALSAHIAILDKDGAILEINRAWREFSRANTSKGFDLPVHKGANYLSVCETSTGPTSDEAAAMAAGIRAVMGGAQKEFSLEYSCHSPDEKRWFNARVTRFPGEGDLRIVVAHENITELKLAEEAFATSEAELRALFASMQDVVLVIDRQGFYRKVAPTNPGLLAKPALELLGSNLQDVFPAEQVRVFMEAIQRVLETKQTIQIEYELQIEGRGAFFETSISPMDQDSTLWVARDISSRKLAEESLRLSEERYRELFNGMIDGFAVHEIICDESGAPVDYRFLEVNPAFERLTGLKSDNLIGKTALEVLPNTEPYWIEVYGNVALTGRSMFYENYSQEIGRHFEVSAYCPRPGQFAVVIVDITERKQAEQDIRQHVAELETLYKSGLALSQLLNPKEIGQKILELLGEKLDWHHSRIRLYHPQDDRLELLDFNQPGVTDEAERREMVARYQSLITHSGQGISGWVVQHGQPVRCGDVRHDPRYVEAYPGIQSGLYVPMKLGERMIGVISIEDEQTDAFSEADERLIATLASQAASAFENARLFEEIRQRVMELETLNRISLVLRAASRQKEMLSIVLDEALAILHTSHGSIELYNRSTNLLEQTIMRGWTAQITAPHPASEGIAGKVFTSGEIYISREFAADSGTRTAARGQIPPGWGGVCLPIRTTQQTLGVMIVSMPSEHELNKNEIRLLSILSEMTGAALQRLQLHEQTVHHLERLNGLRAIDQAIASNLDMRLTLKILLNQTMNQLSVDAADVLLLHPGSNLLKVVAEQGFHTRLLENTSLSDSIAGRTILEHQSITTLDFESATLRENPQFVKLWKEEGFVRYWCVPLVVKGEVKGVLEVYRRSLLNPDAEWIEFLEMLAGQAAIAIDNTQLFENLQRANIDLSMAYDATIEGWSRAMDLRDHETEGHTLRVTDLTIKLARAMNISESQLTAIRRGALLHDIGKMGIPDSILLKEGDLTKEEWVMMRRHPQLALDMLKPIAYLNNALDIPYCHHEKWDGSGYPRGLKGEQIPLAARIFAVADVYDAITNNRPYRKAQSKEEALRYIRKQSGSHFDAQIVEKFLELREH